MFKARLQNLDMVDVADWIDQVGVDAFHEMREVVDRGDEVVVLCQAVESDSAESSYYDIVLPSGAEVDAIQGVHLVGIDQYTELSDQLDCPNGMQFGVTLKVVNHSGGPIDYTAFELLIKQAISEKMSQLKMMQVEVDSVQFETNFPLP